MPAHTSSSAAFNVGGFTGYAALANGGLHGMAAATVMPHGAGASEVATSSGGFDSWLNTTLPTSAEDAVLSGPRSLLDGSLGGDDPAPPQTKPRWAITGDADAGCARAAPVDFSTGAQANTALHGQFAPPVQMRSPHNVSDWTLQSQ